MWNPFRKKERYSFKRLLREPQLIEFIKALLSGAEFYEIRTLTKKMILILDADHFVVQEKILEFLNQPERKRIRQVALYCTCEMAGKHDPDCPVHGVYETMLDGKKPENF